MTSTRAETMTTDAKDMAVGDTIDVFGPDTITRIEPYDGPLACMQGGWVFYFVRWTLGMSVAPGDCFYVL